MIAEHDNDRRLVTLTQHFDQIADKLVRLMNHVYIIFPGVVHSLVFYSGHLDLRVIQHLFLRIISVRTNCDRVNKIRLIRCIVQRLFHLADQDLILRPGAKRCVLADIHHFLTRKGIESHH